MPALFRRNVGIDYACEIPTEMIKVMNTSNPFQIPVCLQRADYQQRRRERFKKGFIAALAAVVVLLVGLLIEGCMTEKTATPPPAPKVTEMPRSSANLVSAPKPVLAPAPAPAANDPAPSTRSQAVYIVKVGDTLSRIAKAHGTSVKAIKAANNLENDRIVVGAKLKVPQV